MSDYNNLLRGPDSKEGAEYREKAECYAKSMSQVLLNE